MGRRACLARCRLNHGGKREKECKLTYSNCRALFWLVDVLVHADHIGHCMTEYTLNQIIKRGFHNVVAYLNLYFSQGQNGQIKQKFFTLLINVMINVHVR